MLKMLPNRDKSLTNTNHLQGTYWRSLSSDNLLHLKEMLLSVRRRFCSLFCIITLRLSMMFSGVVSSGFLYFRIILWGWADLWNISENLHLITF